MVYVSADFIENCNPDRHRTTSFMIALKGVLKTSAIPRLAEMLLPRRLTHADVIFDFSSMQTKPASVCLRTCSWSLCKGH